MPDRSAPLTNKISYIRHPFGVHDLLPEVTRDAMYSTLGVPDPGNDYVTGTWENVASVSQTLNLSAVVGARHCHQAGLLFTFANAQANVNPWRVRVVPYQYGAPFDDIILVGENLSMANTVQRFHCMPIGRSGIILVNFFLAGSPTDDIVYTCKVKWFATTVELDTLPTP